MMADEQGMLFSENAFGLEPKSIMDGAAGQAAKEAGQASVANESWIDKALAKLREFAAHNAGGFLMEEFRDWYLGHGHEAPHHQNAWGALTTVACKQKIIERTGEWRKASAKKSHVSEYPVWRPCHG